MIRILQCVNNMHRAGLETVLMNYYRNIDRTRVQFDFLVHRQEESDYDREILAKVADSLCGDSVISVTATGSILVTLVLDFCRIVSVTGSGLIL